MKKSDPIPGAKYNKLTVIQIDGKRHWKKHVLCSCECGGTSVVDWYNLRMGYTKSCGCLKIEWQNKVRQVWADTKTLPVHGIW
jgi:hypothetical protein